MGIETAIFATAVIGAGATGYTAKRARRASLIKRVSALYRAGKRIPLSLLRSRTKA